VSRTPPPQRQSPQQQGREFDRHGKALTGIERLQSHSTIMMVQYCIFPTVSNEHQLPSSDVCYSPRRIARLYLIELMVVLVIIGVLAALIVPNVLDRADDARVTAAKTDIANINQALKLYRLDNQRYPTAEQGLQALVAKPTTGPAPQNWKPYLEKLPNDPGAILINT
jgi:type II secretion system protein G